MQAERFSMDDNSLRKVIDQTSAEQHAQLLSGSWWHSIDLGDGRVTPGVHTLEELQDNYRRFQLPGDLRGKRVLDIGCWDGFYSFEAERTGAEVVAIDSWRPDNFFKARAALGSRVEFRELSVYEVTRKLLGEFDIVLLLGVLYHLRHPLLALERVCEVTSQTAVIESHVIDSIFPTDHPIMEFYEEDELGGQYDNWWGPNRDCLRRMLRAAGFARSEVLRADPARTVVRAHRTWEESEMELQPSMQILDLVNAVTLEKVFPVRGRYAFLDLSVSGLPEWASRETVKIEIGGFGIRPSYVGPSGDVLRASKTQINVPIPPGLSPGETSIRVLFDQRKSQEYQFELSEGSEW